MAKRRRLRRMGFFALGLFFAYLLGCWSAARGYLRPYRNLSVAPKWVESVEIPTIDGDDPAWVTPGLAKSKVVFVLVHGYGGGRPTWSKMMKDLETRGWGAVAPCMPGQDASPAQEVGFGRREAATVVDTVKWVRKEAPQAKVVLLGISLGGSACWLASELDPSVDAIVTESAFARFDEAMNGFFDHRLPGGRIICKPVMWFAQRMSGIDPSSIVPLDSAAKWTKPALVIQSLADDLIVPSHGTRLARASNAELWELPDAQHAACYDTDPDGYMAHVAALVRKLGVAERVGRWAVLRFSHFS